MNAKHIPFMKWLHEMLGQMADARSRSSAGQRRGCSRSPVSVVAFLHVCGTICLEFSFAAGAQTCSNAPSGLVAWYRAESNANDSVSTANGIFFNPAYAAGKVGQAFSFNGSSSFVEIPVVPVLNFTNTNPMSVEFWANRTGTAATMQLLGKRGSACGAVQYEISLTPGAGLAFDTGNSSVTTGYQMPTNVWIHLAVTFDGSNILFYTNGILAASGTGVLGTANGAPIYLGTSSSCPGFAGLLDEVSFYNRALSASEVQEIFTAGSAGKCPLPPTITSQPQSQTVPAGTNVTFSVVAAGASPLSYQWQFNSTNLAGATSSSLMLTNVQASNGGNYSVVVSNGGGSMTSSNAMLVVTSCYPAPAGLVSWWPGEGSASDVFGTNNGTLIGGVAFAPGMVGLAFDLNGTNQYVNIPDNASLNPAASLTLEAWIYPRLPLDPISSPIMKKAGQGASQQDGYTLEFAETNGVRLIVYVDFNGSASPIRPVAFNQWNHVAGVFDGTNVYIYVNGVYGGSGPAPGHIIASGNDLQLGHDASNPSRYYNGLIDEATIYNTALTAAQIQGIYAAGKCVPPPYFVVEPVSQTTFAGGSVTFTAAATGQSPLAYQWQFNGTNITGATQTALNLTNVSLANTGSYSVAVSNAAETITSSNAILTVIVPGTACTPGPTGLVAWWRAENNAVDTAGTNNGIFQGGIGFAAGEVSQAFSFNGVDAALQIPDSPNLNFTGTSPMSVEFWAYRTGSQSVMHFLGKRTPGCGSAWEYQLGFDPTDGLFFVGAGSSGVFTGVQMPLNTWMHLAGIFDGSTFRFYTNGVLAGTGSGTLGSFTSVPLIIGTSGGCPYFAGLIDEVSIYNRALSAGEVQSIYFAESFGKCGVPPALSVQPANQNGFVGQSVSFSSLATGYNPLGYQWAFNGTNINGATNRSLVLTNLQAANGGVYSVMVTNPFGSASSSNALLSIIIPVCTPVSSNLVGWWAGESNANDNTGINNGMLQGGVSFAPGEIGQAFSFNGSNGIVLAPDSVSLEVSNQLTIEAWINVLRTNGDQTLVGKVQTASGNNGYEMGLSRNLLYGQFNSPGLPWPSSVIQYPLPVNLGTWNHVAFTYDQSAMKLYLNGQAVATNAVGPAIINSTPGSELCIGGESINQQVYFKGLMDEVSVYNTALSAAQIQAIYNASSVGKCSLPPAFVAQPQSATVLPGTNVTFTASARGGNPLVYQWQRNGSNISGANSSSLTLTNVQTTNTGIYTITASNSLGFITSSNAVLNVELVTILGNGQVLSNSQYTFGNSVTIQLQNFYTNGDILYTLDGSTPSFSSTPYTGPFVLTQNAIVQALGYDVNFSQSGLSDSVGISIVPTFTLTAITAGGGTISLNPTNSPYLSNSVVGLMATPSNGWSFLQWAGDVSGTNLTNSVLMNGNRSVQALFGTSLGTASSAGGSVLRSPSAALYPFGMSVQLSALPQTNNYFALWGNAASGNFNPLYFVLTNANPTVSALFVALGSNQVSLAVIPVGHGRVSVVPQANVFTNGQAVTITATPETNQVFLGWSGDASGTQNPLTISMGPSKTIYANFSKIYNFGFTPLTGLGLKAGFQLNLTGEIPVAYRFDASTNLTNWLPLITLTNYTGTLQYKDTNATNFNLRFYRGVPLP